jgi:hypothetical protein
MRRCSSSETCHTIRVVSALFTAVLALGAPCGARADELDDLRRENARLTAEVRALQAELAAARAGIPVADGGSVGTSGATGTRLEPVYIPRTRVSIEVGTDEASGKTTLATLWYRTADAGPLPRKEWLQLRAEQSADGTVDGPWLLVEREGGGASAKVASGRLTADGTALELPAVDYDVKRRARAIGTIDAGSRSERVRFALPASALPQVAGARTASFSAGGIAFTLTDEHLSAFAAMAARLAPPRPSPVAAAR